MISVAISYGALLTLDPKLSRQSGIERHIEDGERTRKQGACAGFNDD